MGDIRVRLSPEGIADLDELRGAATRALGEHVDYDGALRFALGFYKTVDPQERARAETVARRGRGPRLVSVPSSSGPGAGTRR
jgi:hypothetical protein